MATIRQLNSIVTLHYRFLHPLLSDIDYCLPQLNPCDDNAFCMDLSAPKHNATCHCKAGYVQNTTGVWDACPGGF